MGIKIDSDSTEPDVRIDLVPLIDVIFCILTFFILAAVTLTRQAAINVDLPRAESGTSQLRKNLIVSVDPIGQTYLEKQPVSDTELYQAIVNFQQQTPEGMVVLYASRAASYNDVVRVLDFLRSAGGNRVALATLPGTEPGAVPDLNAPFPNLPSIPSDGLNNSNSPGRLTPGNSNGNPFAPLPNSPGSSNRPGGSAPSDLNPAPRTTSPSGRTSPTPNSSLELPSGSSQINPGRSSDLNN